MTKTNHQDLNAVTELNAANLAHLEETTAPETILLEPTETTTPTPDRTTPTHTTKGNYKQRKLQ